MWCLHYFKMQYTAKCRFYMTITESKQKFQKVVVTTILTKVLKNNILLGLFTKPELLVNQTLGTWIKLPVTFI